MPLVGIMTARVSAAPRITETVIVFDQDIEALGHRDREAAGCYRMHGVAVGRDHAADEFAKIDPELARGCAVDDTEPETASTLDTHDLRIGECSIVGEEGIVVNIIQAHSHAA